MNINAKLLKLRTEHNLSQAQLGSHLKVSKATISAWENGKRAPKIKNIVAIAKFYKTKVDYLIGLNEASADDILCLKK